MTDKLKNCPFCGGEADTEWHHGYWGVRCKSCYAEVTADGMNDAIAAWNTRKPMDRIIEQLEELAEDARIEDYCPDSKYRDGCIENCQLCYVFASIKNVKGVQNE